MTWDHALGLAILGTSIALLVVTTPSVSNVTIWLGRNIGYVARIALATAILAGAAGIIGWDDVGRTVLWAARITKDIPWEVWLAIIIAAPALFKFVERACARRPLPPMLPPHNPYGKRDKDDVI